MWHAQRHCQLCNSNSHLDVHHRTYKHFKHEDPEDLTVLCRVCHTKMHDRLPRPPDHELTNHRPIKLTPTDEREAAARLIDRINRLARYETNRVAHGKRPNKKTRTTVCLLLNEHPRWKTPMASWGDIMACLREAGLTKSQVCCVAGLWSAACRRDPKTSLRVRIAQQEGNLRALQKKLQKQTQ